MNIKEWFLEKPYYLRGGLILLFINIIISVFAWWAYPAHTPGMSTGYTLTFANLPFILISMPLLDLLPSTIPNLDLIVMNLIGLIGYFLVGCLLGGLYGKINKRRISQRKNTKS